MKLTDELYRRKNELIPYGLEFRVIQVMLKQFLDKLEALDADGRAQFLGAILAEHLTIDDWMTT